MKHDLTQSSARDHTHAHTHTHTHTHTHRHTHRVPPPAMVHCDNKEVNICFKGAFHIDRTHKKGDRVLWPEREGGRESVSL